MYAKGQPRADSNKHERTVTVSWHLSCKPMRQALVQLAQLSGRMPARVSLLGKLDQLPRSEVGQVPLAGAGLR